MHDDQPWLDGDGNDEPCQRCGRPVGSGHSIFFGPDADGRSTHNYFCRPCAKVRRAESVSQGAVITRRSVDADEAAGVLN